MPVKHIIRTNSGGKKQVELTRGIAIQANCTECTGWGSEHPRNCPDVLCPLYPFRGKTLLAYDRDEDEECAAADATSSPETEGE